jgi:AAA domain
MNDDGCPVCGREACENPLHVPSEEASYRGLNPDRLASVAAVVAEGQALDRNGIPYLVDNLIPAYGGFGMLVARAKVGKTTLAYQLGAAVATGVPFLERMTKQTRVLIVAAEDPPQYTAWLARHLDDVPEEMMTFYRGPIRLDAEGLTAIADTITTGHYGLVLIASWQAVIRGLVAHENDNMGLVNIVESAKQFARETNVPWLCDAHAGKGEDQTDEADPSLALRGASSAAGAADYTLSLRYADSPFSTKRRLSGKGRFVNLAPLLIDCPPDRHHYTLVGETKTVSRDTIWKLIVSVEALTDTPQSAYAIAKTIGIAGTKGRDVTGLRQVRDALHGRPGVKTIIDSRNGRPLILYAKGAEATEPADPST